MNDILTGKIVKGLNVAKHYTLIQQAPSFEKKGIGREFLTHGTINVDISPYQLKIVTSDIKFKDMIWYGVDGNKYFEDFNFLKLQILFEGTSYPGMLYVPVPTKDSSIIEVISDYIPEIRYEKPITITIPSHKIKLLRDTDGT